MGLWKFSDKIPASDLEEVATLWAKDSAYTQIYIRKASKDQRAIGFAYILSTEDTSAGHDQYLEETSDFLKRKFGNGLVGWDISSPVMIIK